MTAILKDNRRLFTTAAYVVALICCS